LAKNPRSHKVEAQKMNDPFQERAAFIKKTLLSLNEGEERYAYLIELGRKAKAYPADLQQVSNIVSGCQSILYLHAQYQEGKLFFIAHSEALISAGLAALLISLYNGSTPEIILTNPPLFLQEIGLLASLSPSRSNGFASIYLRMQQEAMKKIVKTP
jgi:cysteine desulfuration protein SufE